MKKQTALKRLNKNYHESKNRRSYKIMIDLLTDTNNTYRVNGNIIRPCVLQGSGGYIKNVDDTNDVRELLEMCGIKYEFGNDAPRGGLPGNYFKVKNLK